MIKLAGIFAVYKKKKLSEQKNKLLEECALKLKHRGPKHTFRYEKFPIMILFHHKEIKTNKYPLNFSFNQDNNKFIAIDGQIYNLDELNQKYLNSDYQAKYNKKTNLEGLIEGYEKIESEIFKKAIGSFSGILLKDDELIGFRDPIGAKPLFCCNTEEFFAFSSELKGLAPFKDNIKPIPPGYIFTSSGKIKSFYQYPKFKQNYNITNDSVKPIIKELNRLVKIIIADNIRNGEKAGVLLSGGLDSSIVAYVAKDLIDDLHVYTAGVKGSKDPFYSNIFSKLYNLNYINIEITLKEILECLPDLIYALETFDATVVRSSIPLFLISQYIKSKNSVDVLLTGDGGNTLFGGYNYLQDLKSFKSLNQELLKILGIEYKTSLQRVDRIPFFFSIEARAPLFDRRLVELSFKIPAEIKIFRKKGIGIAKKWILRKAFEKEIPSEFIWRKKKTISKGAGIQSLIQDYFEKIITDHEFNAEKQLNSQIIVGSKEELYYWRIFKSKFNLTTETLSEIDLTGNYDL